MSRVPNAILELDDQFVALTPIEDRKKVANLVAREVWNACPIPANGFRRDPLPDLKRNDRCVCGSGLKFKQCCRNLPPLPFTDLNLWPILLSALSEKQLEDAISTRQIPIEYYSDIGLKRIERGDSQSTVKLLETLFTGGRKIDDSLGQAMNVLCDAYDDLEDTSKKLSFLKNMADLGNGVSSDAWQRLTTIHLDDGDLEASQNAFNQAMRTRPDDVNLATLEILLMMEQGKDSDEVKQRITFWKMRLERWGLVDDPIMEFLNEVEEDAGAGLSGGKE